MWQKSFLKELPFNLSVCSSLEWLEAVSRETDNLTVYKYKNCFFPSSIVNKLFLKSFECFGSEKRSFAGLISSSLCDVVPAITRKNINEKVDLIDLRRVPEDQSQLLFPDMKSRHISSDGAYYVLSLDVDSDEYFSGLKKNFKKNLKSSRNKLSKDYVESECEFLDYKVTNDNWSLTFDLWKKVDSNSWQGKKNLTAIHNDSKLNFLKRIIDSNIEARVFLFLIKNEPIAIKWIFFMGDSCLFYSAQFDTRFSIYRPSHLLTDKAIRYCFSKGIKDIDFGNGDSGHKKDWLAKRIPLVRIIVPISLAGEIWFYYQKMRWCVGRKIRKKYNH